MSIQQERREAIQEMVDKARENMEDNVNIASINQTKRLLMELCKRSELFPREDFPIPSEGEQERMYLVHVDDDGKYALYVNSALPGQKYRPHNHGGTWAIVAAVEGEERHDLYRETSPETIERVNEIVVQPGVAVSMLDDGIHSIEAVGDSPILHLHFYGRSFEAQGMRKEYDIENERAELVPVINLDAIEDAR